MTRWLAVSLLSTVALAQNAVSSHGMNRMEISMERFDGKLWKAIDSRLVLAADDRIRFKFKANFEGFLYVTNQSTSGTTQMLYPREDTGSANRIEPGKEYVVPATAGYFRVAGPEGYDVISWLVSPIDISKTESHPKAPAMTDPPAEQTPTASEPLPAGLKPRCDDSIFRARGDCVDTSAGPKALDNNAQSRSLVFIREKKASVISAPAPLTGPVVYEFHLAHK
jgi:hypothetical protein